MAYTSFCRTRECSLLGESVVCSRVHSTNFEEKKKKNGAKMDKASLFVCGPCLVLSLSGIVLVLCWSSFFPRLFSVFVVIPLTSRALAFVFLLGCFFFSFCTYMMRVPLVFRRYADKKPREIDICGTWFIVGIRRS